MVPQGTRQRGEKQSVIRGTFVIRTCEHFWSIALLRERGERTAATVDAGYADRNHGHEDDDVHERVETPQAGVLPNQDKRRGINVGIRVSAEEAVISRVDEQADKEQAQDVEERDTPENLLDGTGQTLNRVLRLSSREAHKLGTAERKGGSNKNGAEASEAVSERARVVPQAGAPVLAVVARGGPAAQDEDEGDDHEDDDGGQLEAAGPELLLGVADCAEDVDDYDEDEEYRDPDCY